MAAEDRKDWRDLLSAQLSREAMLKILEVHDKAAREALAKRTDASPEVLFLLANEGSEAARRAVAANPSAPAHANRLLADDADDEVRVELARKIGRLLPDLTADESKRLRDLTIETLERLARDQLVRVRRILAEEIKHLDCVPRAVIKRLARDVESVAAPILEYSPLLSDADLIEIVTTAQARFALLCVAKRRPLSPSVSEVVAAALDVPAVAALLANSGAHIRRQTLDKIADQAVKVTEWHMPLVLRNDLSKRAMRRLAGFVSSALIAKLAARGNLDEKTRRHLKQRMQERLDKEGIDPEAPKGTDVAALFKAGKLNDSFVESAVEMGRRETLITALSLLAKVPEDSVRRILQSGSAKPVTALVWRAKLTMRVAFKIQSFVMHLAAGELLPAREGVHFPLTEDEMRWHLNYFGVRG
jgi:uncharacterized protein (DUF2336 family)